MSVARNILRRCAAAALLGTAWWWAGPAALANDSVKAPAPALPLEQFFQRPAVLEAKLSPTGRRVAMTTSHGGPRVGLVVIELGATVAARRVVTFGDADVTRFDWVGDDRLVFSVTDLEAGSGEDRHSAPGLYAVDADGSAFRQLVRRQGRPFVSSGTQRDPALDWNHTLLQVPLQQPGVAADEVVIGEMDIGNRTLNSLRPLWLNTRTGRTRAMADLDAPANAVGWLLDSQGAPRVAIARSEGRRLVHWRGPGDTKWRLLADDPLLQPRFTPHAVADDGVLYVTRAEGSDGIRTLTRFDFANNAPQSPSLVIAPGFDFNGTLVRDRPGAALGVRLETDAETTVWFDPALKRMQQTADDKLPGRVNRLQCRRCGAPDMVVLVHSYADRDPGRLWLYEAAGERWYLISDVLQGIDPRRMASVGFERIKARDGRDLPLWLTLPPGVPDGQPAPAIVLVHGGPWSRGGHWRWQPMEQFLASRGYLVISPEFRGSTGYGHAHYRAGWKQWGQAMQDDVADALRWAQNKGLADKRACIAGASYGGYSALMGLVRDPELYRCGIAWLALTDPFLLLEGSWWVDDDSNSDVRRHMLPSLVGDVTQDAAMLTAASPLAQAGRIRAPLLLAFGESDLRVPLAHGKRLRSALEEAGRPPEWITYANEAHGWRQLSTRIDFARRVERFLAQHLRGEAAAAPR